MFTKSDDQGYRELIEGVRMKTLTFGDKTLLVNIKIARGAIIPSHQHFHEQSGFLVSGSLDFIIAGEHYAAEAGDSWTIPGDIPHCVEAIAESNIIEVFSPVRADYLP